MTHKSQRLIWFSDMSAGVSRRLCRSPIVVALCLLRTFPVLPWPWKQRCSDSPVWTFSPSAHSRTELTSPSATFSVLSACLFFFMKASEEAWFLWSWKILQVSLSAALQHNWNGSSSQLMKLLSVAILRMAFPGTLLMVSHVCLLTGSTVVLN